MLIYQKEDDEAMKKKILATILSVFTLFSAISFSACEVTDVLFADYKEQIAQLQETINEKEEQIATLKQENENLQGKITELQEDFVLKLSMEKEVYAQEEFISVEVVLENHSGEDIEIFYYGLWRFESDTICVFWTYEYPPYPTKKTLKDGESLRFTDYANSEFSAGRHVVKCRAVFYLDEACTNSVIVHSNELEFKIVN